MTRKKIVHLITSLGGGGTENFLYQILAQTPAGYDSRVAYLQNDGVIGDRIRALGIPVEHAPSPWHFARYLKREKPDILHTCLYWANQTGRWIGHLEKVPVIVSSQRAIAVWEKPWHPILDRWTLHWCTGIVANSRAAERLIKNRLGHASRQPVVLCIPNGLDFERFQPGDREQARQQFQISPDAIVGGTLARLHREKGAEKIPDFAERLLSQHPRLILLVAGTGPLLSELQDRTKSWKDRIRFVGWQEDSARFLSTLDFFWLLSREESFPQALLEASGMAVPWAAPEVGDIAELLKAGAAGLLYPVNDMTAAASQCSELIQQSASWTAKAAQARGVLEKKYSLDHMAATFFGFLKELEPSPPSK